MDKAIKVGIGIMCIPLIILGLTAMFNPMGLVERLSVIPQGIHGLNTIRGDVGGLLMSAALLMIIGLWRSNTTWFLAVAVIMITVMFGRVIGLVVDGTDATLIPPFAVEIIVLGLMLAAHKRASES